jgi:hypothetical protein
MIFTPAKQMPADPAAGLDQDGFIGHSVILESFVHRSKISPDQAGRKASG